MKTPICWFYRRILRYILVGGGALPRMMERHLRRCPGCREVARVERELTQQLQDEAGAQIHSLPPFLHARIMASVRRGPLAIAPHRALLSPGWAFAVLVIGLGVFSFILIERQTSNHRTIQAWSEAS